MSVYAFCDGVVSGQKNTSTQKSSFLTCGDRPVIPVALMVGKDKRLKKRKTG
jgi:hypothetical protein